MRLFELPPRAQLDRLRAREQDAAVLGNIEGVERERYVIHRLSRHPMAAVLPDNHELAGRKRIPLGALRGEEWVSLSDVYFPGRREWFRKACAVGDLRLG